jgi:hypothetical protein
MRKRGVRRDVRQDLYGQIPDDFPRPVSCPVPIQPGSGSVVEWDGQNYLAGCTPPEMYQQWRYCEWLATLFAEKCMDSSRNTSSRQTRAQILERHLSELARTNLVTAVEAKWVIRRAAKSLDWTDI